MNRALLLTLVAAATALAANPEQGEQQKLRALILSLPPREHLIEDVKTYERTAATADEKREAVERLEKAKQGFDQLKPFLRPGTSVLDYPGLLALARPHYTGYENTYYLLLGIPPGWNYPHEEGNNKSEYKVFFDSRGVITELTPSIYKN
jgi:hypothetical protein